MTAKAAICQALLNGHTLNVKNCFHLFGITNASREMSRMIERPFGITLKRTPREGKSRYGQSCTWFDYNLELTQSNAIGIKKMVDYVTEQRKSDRKTDAPRTPKEVKNDRNLAEVGKYVQQQLL